MDQKRSTGIEQTLGSNRTLIDDLSTKVCIIALEAIVLSSIFYIVIQMVKKKL